LHVLNEACPIFINISHYEQCVVSFSHQDKQNCDVELDNGFSLPVQLVVFALEFLVEPFDEFAMAAH